MESYNINYHLYADGSNLYVAFKTNDASSVKTRIESCVGDICRWMNRNDFKLNEIRKFVMALPLSDKATSLGVVLDKHMSFDHHIRHRRKSLVCHFRNLFKIRNLDKESDAAARSNNF